MPHFVALFPGLPDAVLSCEFRTEKDQNPRIEWKKKGKAVTFVYFNHKFTREWWNTFPAWIPSTSPNWNKTIFFCLSFHHPSIISFDLSFFLSWVLLLPSFHTVHYRVLRRTGKDRGSNADNTLCYSERLGGIPLWGDCQRGPRQPWGGDCDPQCPRYDA